MTTMEAEMWSAAPHDTTYMEADPDQVVERWGDDAELTESPCTLTVYGLRRAVLPANCPDADEIMDRILEDLDDEYDRDGDGAVSAAGRSRILELAQALCAGVRDEYVPWSYERILGCSIQYRVWREAGILGYERV